MHFCSSAVPVQLIIPNSSYPCLLEVYALTNLRRNESWAWRENTILFQDAILNLPAPKPHNASIFAKPHPLSFTVDTLNQAPPTLLNETSHHVHDSFLHQMSSFTTILYLAAVNATRTSEFHRFAKGYTLRNLTLPTTTR